MFLKDILGRPRPGRLPYYPFGVLVPKAWLYEHGGRPVVYQHEAEYELLDTQQQWRHVRYEPCTTPPVDFSWEREWRIRTDELRFTPEDVKLVVPEWVYVDDVLQSHEAEQNVLAEYYQACYGDMGAYALREEFPWETVVLTDLGAPGSPS